MFSIDENKIYKDFITDIQNIIEKIGPEEIRKRNFSLTKKEKFFFNLFNRLNEINDKNKDLKLSIKFISTFPNYLPWRRSMTRNEYIIYHLEYYYINIVALFDRFLHLINSIYDLGLADRYVTLNCIVSNSKVDKRLKNLLKEFDKAINGIRSAQNGIKHKGKLRDNKMNDASLFEWGLQNKDVLGNFNSKYLCGDMNFLYRKYIKEKKEELKKNNEKIDKFIEIFLDGIFTQYEKIKPR